MRHKLNQKGSVIAVLDIGTAKTACFIAQIKDDEDGLEIVGVGHQASNGIRNGVIANLDAAENSVRKAVHAAESMAAGPLKGYPLQDVVVNLPGNVTMSRILSVDVQVMGHTVGEGEWRRAQNKARQLVPQSTEEQQQVIHLIPAAFTLDGQTGIHDPTGMVGENLQVDMCMIHGNITPIRNIRTCLSRSHLDMAAACSGPYASGLSCTSADERELGCTVIDMGAGLTSIAVFRGGHLIYTGAVPAGGHHVTKDIARGLTTGIQDAERIKTLYGGAIATDNDDTAMIDVPPVGEEDAETPNYVPRSLLIGVIRPRVEELFELVRAQLEDSGIAQAAGRRVILTGGASQLPGMRDLAAAVLNKQVRLGRPRMIEGLAENASGPAFACPAGLLTYLSARHAETPDAAQDLIQPTTIWGRIAEWFRAHW